MTKLLSSKRFLAAYSGILTIAFILTVALGLTRGDFSLHKVAAAEQSSPGHADYDTITVHRINIVEPNGTPRLIIADKAEYPGSFFKGNELPRPDRSDAAGMLFMNDEGTENGGLIFGGHQSSDGKFHSFGHLSFDEYEQDQTLSIDTSQEGEERQSGYQINDNGTTLLTPDVFATFQKIRSMPDGPAKDKARAEFRSKYSIAQRTRAGFARLPDKSSQFALADPRGHTRILLRVAADGTPTMQFLDANGKVTQQWPESARK